MNILSNDSRGGLSGYDFFLQFSETLFLNFSDLAITENLLGELCQTSQAAKQETVGGERTRGHRGLQDLHDQRHR